MVHHHLQQVQASQTGLQPIIDEGTEVIKPVVASVIP